ncbi:hypothetical protein [Sunxiuqinia sp. sy24]|uniref:hypothetical protein n=1 Tax=Sunxiuqinia sp. sy24 TaxID=3461495 RepID=UPI004045F0B1
MEDYIFILIAIVLSIFGAINKNQKKKMAQMEEEEEAPSHQPSFFDQVFDDPVFREDPMPEPKSVVVEKTKTFVKKTMQQERVERTPLRSSVLKKTEIGDAIHKNKIASGPNTEEVETEAGNDSLLSNFSLRKAVIYAEILERKY